MSSRSETNISAAVFKINPRGQRLKQRNRIRCSTQEGMVAWSREFPDLKYWGGSWQDFLLSGILGRKGTKESQHLTPEQSEPGEGWRLTPTC